MTISILVFGLAVGIVFYVERGRRTLLHSHSLIVSAVGIGDILSAIALAIITLAIALL